MPLEAGQLFGNYRVVRLLGEGGFGEVYLAENPLIERRAAVKVLHTALARDAELVRRFLNEARAASAIPRRCGAAGATGGAARRGHAGAGCSSQQSGQWDGGSGGDRGATECEAGTGGWVESPSRAGGERNLPAVPASGGCAQWLQPCPAFEKARRPCGFLNDVLTMY